MRDYYAYNGYLYLSRVFICILATLDQLFNPEIIAIVGATPKEGKVGNTLLKNVVVISAGFKEAGREGGERKCT